MPRPSRRQVLSALCSGSGVLFAGCTAGPEASNETNETPTTGGEREKTPPESTRSVPNIPGTTTSNACPPVDRAEQGVCYDAVDPEAMPIVLVPESQSVQPEQPVQFTLRNRSDHRFETNFYHWELHKRVDGDWYSVAPEYWPQPLTPLEAGEEHTWTVTVETGRVNDGASLGHVEGTESLTIAGLGGGHYAFGTDGWFAAGSDTETIDLATGFELHTDQLQLTPTAAISDTTWDGETLVARSTRPNAAGDDQQDTFVLERIDDSDVDAERVIVEQVVRNDQLRDSIALSRQYGADRVHLEAFSGSFPPSVLDDARTFAFDGIQFRVTVTD